MSDRVRDIANESASSRDNGVARAPTITMPKGGGAIRGIGEKFAANPVTGTGSMSVPIATSPGRLGFGPQLSLSYDSGAGNGPFGFGWSFSLPSITRKTDKGLPQYLDAVDSDVFILSGADDLVPVLVQNAQGKWERENLPTRTVNRATYRVAHYRPRIEGLFARIERWTNIADATDVFWRSISKDNITTWYGKTADSRIVDPADPSRIFSWLICQSHDDKGNVIVYDYKSEDSARIFEDASGNRTSKTHERNRTDASRSVQRYLERIRYGNRSPYFPALKDDAPWPEPPDANAHDGSNAWCFEVVLDYGEYAANAPTPNDAGTWPARSDPFSSYRAGFETHPREAITYHYERRLPPILNGQIVDEAAAASDPNTEWHPDPRIQHALTLEVDGFGNVLKEAAIGYGRRFDAPDVALVPEDRERQRLIHITCTHNSFTNPILETDVYRTPLLAETRTHELRRATQERSSNSLTNLYRFDDLSEHVTQSDDGSHDVDYEDIQCQSETDGSE